MSTLVTTAASPVAPLPQTDTLRHLNAAVDVINQLAKHAQGQHRARWYGIKSAVLSEVIESFPADALSLSYQFDGVEPLVLIHLDRGGTWHCIYDHLTFAARNLINQRIGTPARFLAQRRLGAGH